MNYRAITGDRNIIYEKMVEASKGDHPLLDYNVMHIRDESGIFIKKSDFINLQHSRLSYSHSQGCTIWVNDITRRHGCAPLELEEIVPGSLSLALSTIESIIGVHLEEVEIHTIFKPTKKDDVTQIRKS